MKDKISLSLVNKKYIFGENMLKIKSLFIGCLAATAVMFSGCAQNGLQSSSMGGTQVNSYFEQGVVVNVNKVMLNQSNKNTTTGVLGGAAVGALLGNAVKGSTKGTLIGAVGGAALGGVAGATMGSEEESYETTINSNGRMFVVYLEKRLREGARVEFLLRGNEISNVNVR